MGGGRAGAGGESGGPGSVRGVRAVVAGVAATSGGTVQPCGVRGRRCRCELGGGRQADNGDIRRGFSCHRPSPWTWSRHQLRRRMHSHALHEPWHGRADVPVAILW